MFKPYTLFFAAVFVIQEEQKLATLGLEALGDLSLCASELMNPYMGELIPFIITSMQDSTSSTRREVSEEILIL